MKFFISYRRMDSSNIAKQIYKILTKNFGRENVFWDIESISPGADFVNVLRNKLSDSDIVLVLINQNWLHIKDAIGNRRIDDPDDFVRIEIEHAILNQLHVIPILINDTKMPNPDELPSERLKQFTRCNAFRIHEGDKFDTDIAKLIEKLPETVSIIEKPLQKLPEKHQNSPSIDEKDKSTINMIARSIKSLPKVVQFLAGLATIVSLGIAIIALTNGNNSTPISTDTLTPVITLTSTELPTFTPLPVYTSTITPTPIFTDLPTFTPLPSATDGQDN